MSSGMMGIPPSTSQRTVQKVGPYTAKILQNKERVKPRYAVSFYLAHTVLLMLNKRTFL